MSLTDWRKNGWLIEHRTSAREIADLFAVVERDLADSAAEQVSGRIHLSATHSLASRRGARRAVHNYL